MDDVPLLDHIKALLEESDKRYFQRFADLEKTIGVALAASEKAIDKAETAVEKRFDAVNEFRSTLSDQANNFITRSESEVITGRNINDIQELKDRINIMQGRGVGLNAGWAYLASGVALLATLVSIYFAVSRQG